jgi:hypothetical protein
MIFIAFLPRPELVDPLMQFYDGFAAKSDLFFAAGRVQAMAGGGPIRAGCREPLRFHINAMRDQQKLTAVAPQIFG